MCLLREYYAHLKRKWVKVLSKNKWKRIEKKGDVNYIGRVEGDRMRFWDGGSVVMGKIGLYKVNIGPIK